MRKCPASAECELIARPPVMSASRTLCAQQKIGESTVPWLASVVICHAGTFSAVTCYARDVEGAERQREVLRFDNVPIDNDGNGDSSVSLSPSVNLESSFSNHIQSRVRRVFGIPALRPKQEEVIQRQIFYEESNGCLIAVNRTSGRGLILLVTATCV